MKISRSRSFRCKDDRYNAGGLYKQGSVLSLKIKKCQAVNQYFSEVVAPLALSDFFPQECLKSYHIHKITP